MTWPLCLLLILRNPHGTTRHRRPPSSCSSQQPLAVLWCPPGPQLPLASQVGRMLRPALISVWLDPLFVAECRI